MLKSSPEEDATPERPRSHWAAVTAAFTLVLWVPLSLVALPLGRRLAGAMSGLFAVAAAVAPVLIMFAASCFAAGALTGRYGGRAGPREATIGTTLAAFAAWALALSAGSLRPWPVALVTLGLLGFVAMISGALGGRAGFSRRPRI